MCDSLPSVRGFARNDQAEIDDARGLNSNNASTRRSAVKYG